MTPIGLLLGGIILATYVFAVIYTMNEIHRVKELLRKEKKKVSSP